MRLFPITIPADSVVTVGIVPYSGVRSKVSSAKVVQAKSVDA